MRLQPSHDLLRRMREPENQTLRNMMKSLLKNPRPGWATPVQGKPNQYEFSGSGVWIQYVIDDTGMETIIKATVVRRPSFL